MKFLFSLALVLFVSSPLVAEEVDAESFSLGVVFGEPTGPVAKYYFAERLGVDLGVTYSFSEFFLVFSDFHYHFPGFFAGESSDLLPLTPYIGIGGGLRIASEKNPDPGDEDLLGFLRIPLGAEWSFRSVPIAAFLEVVPGMGLIPEVFPLIQLGLGARYIF